MLRRSFEKAKALWKLAASERATPREIGWAIGIGVFAGCTPAIGFHGPVALALATALRKNRLFAWIGSRISNMIFLPFLAMASIQASYFIRKGTWMALDREHIIDNAHALLLDWCLGMFPVGGLLGFILGFVAYKWAAIKQRTRSERPQPSSESPA